MIGKERLGYDAIIARLQALANPANVAGMARYGIRAGKAYGVVVPELRKLAKEAGTDHELALRLWAKTSREARVIASLVADPRLLGEEQLEVWARDFDNWEACDQTCMNLFARSPLAHAKALEWSERPEEFVKRAGFVLMARLAHRDNADPDGRFLPFLDAIAREAGDGRNFVKKAVNWALRDIGKRNLSLNARAVALARELKESKAPAARWVAADALAELEGEAVQSRLHRRADAPSL